MESGRLVRFRSPVRDLSVFQKPAWHSVAPVFCHRCQGSIGSWVHNIGSSSHKGDPGSASSLFSSHTLAFSLSKTVFSSVNKFPLFRLNQIKLVSTGCNQKHLNIYDSKCLCLSSWTVSFLRAGTLILSISILPSCV